MVISNADKNRQGEEDVKNYVFLQTSFMDAPLCHYCMVMTTIVLVLGVFWHQPPGTDWP